MLLQNCCLLGPVFETKAATSKSGDGVGRGLFDTCRVNADVFPGSKLKHRHRNDRCCETHSVGTPSVAEPPGAIFTVSDEL